MEMEAWNQARATQAGQNFGLHCHEIYRILMDFVHLISIQGRTLWVFVRVWSRYGDKELPVGERTSITFRRLRRPEQTESDELWKTQETKVRTCG